jgi:hypothetical protein
MLLTAKMSPCTTMFVPPVASTRGTVTFAMPVTIQSIATATLLRKHDGRQSCGRRQRRVAALANVTRKQHDSGSTGRMLTSAIDEQTRAGAAVARGTEQSCAGGVDARGVWCQLVQQKQGQHGA